MGMKSTQFSLTFVLAFILCGCSVPVGSKSEWSECAHRTSSTGDVVERIFRRVTSVEKQYLFSPEGPVRRYEVSKVELYIQKGEEPRKPLRFLRESGDFAELHFDFLPLDDGLWFALKRSDHRRDDYVAYTSNLVARVFSSSGIVSEAVIVGCYVKYPGYKSLTNEKFLLTPNWRPLRNNIEDYKLNYRVDTAEHRVIFRTYRGDYNFDLRSGLLSAW